jgi:hypothetical protein
MTNGVTAMALQIKKAFVALPILFFALVSTASAQGSDKFGWSVTLYIWASDTSLDISVSDTGIGGGANIKFGDLLDDLDTAIQIHIEGGKGNWSGFGDLTYIETSDTTQRPLLVIDANNKTTVLDAAVAYWPHGVGTQLNLFGGLRYSGFDDSYRITLGTDPLVERRSTKDYYDALLGIRYRFDLSERWAILTRGDVSFGDSEGTWLVQGLFAYTVGKRQRNRIVFGYQYKEAEFRDGDLITEFAYKGPMAGFNFRF